MNNYNINLLDSGEDNYKRFCKSVMSDLKVFLGLPNDISVYVNSSFDADMDKSYKESDYSNQPFARSIEITYEEDPTEFTENSLAFSPGEDYYVFKDTELGVEFAPMVKANKLILTIRINAKSKTIVNSSLNRYKSKISVLREGMRHSNVEYVSYLDNKVLFILGEIHKKRLLVYPNETLSDYILKYRTKDLKTVNSGGNNNKNILAIKSNYFNINGRFTTDIGGLKIQYDSGNKEHYIELNYEVYANIPIELNVQYPTMVFNQIINKNLIESIDPYKHYVGETYYVDQFDNLTRIKRPLYTDKTNLYVNIPEYDTYLLPDNSNIYKKIFSVMLTMIDANGAIIDNTIPIFNLNNLGKKVAINQDVLDFLASGEFEYLCKLLMSAFSLNIFENNRLIDNSKLYLDNNLNVYYTGPVDIKNTYRVTFNICVKPENLHHDAYKRIANNTIIMDRINNIIVINDIYNYDLYRMDNYDMQQASDDYKRAHKRTGIHRTVQSVHVQAAGLLVLKEDIIQKQNEG